MEKAQETHPTNGRRSKAVPQDPAAEHQTLIRAVLKTFTHFFGDITKRLGGVPDPREPASGGKIDYPVASLLSTGILMFLCQLGARRQVRWRLHTVFLVQTFKRLFDVNDVPHGDTMNNVVCALPFEPVQEMVTAMTETLIDKKVLYPYRLFSQYYVVAVDATGILVYDYPHCPHCLTKKHDGKTLYYHHVLEAKIVTLNGFAFSLMTEFIENPEDDDTRSEAQRKQDCELKAFYRLAQRLHQRFPKLPLLLTMDGLYAVGPVFGLCGRFRWKYMIVMSDDQLTTVNEEFEALAAAAPENRLRWRYGHNGEIRQVFRWVNDIAYVDSLRQHHVVSVLECKEKRTDSETDEKATKFKWVTNVAVSQDNAAALGNEGGRIRWKIENEAFNVQKTGGYRLEHAYTNDENGIKIYYLLLQIAHMLIQLLEKGSLLRNAFPKGFGSVKNLAYRILEALRNATLSPEAYHAMCQQRIQIRFVPP